MKISVAFGFLILAFVPATVVISGDGGSSSECAFLEEQWQEAADEANHLYDALTDYLAGHGPDAEYIQLGNEWAAALEITDNLHTAWHDAGCHEIE